MKKTIQYRKDGKVVSFSEGEIETILSQKEINISELDLQKIQSGEYDIYYLNNQLIFQENQNFVEKQKKEQGNKIIKKVKQGTATKEEIADLLDKLLNK